MTIYFPSCNFTRACPETSEKIKSYLKNHHGIEIAGCCRPDHKKPAPGDLALTVCQSCAAIIEENRPDISQLSLIEFLDKDDSFSFPNLHGKQIAIQDCWRAREKTGLHNAGRSLLKKLNANIVELENNRENASFCGLFPFNPIVPGNLAIAPKYFGEVQARLQLLPKDRQQEALDEYCSSLPPVTIACVCNSCLRGLKQGNVKGVHLLELLFGNY